MRTSLAERDAGKRYYEKHRAQKAAAVALWKKNNPDKVRAKRRRRYQREPQLFVEKSRSWRERNPERAKEINRLSYLKNKDKRRIQAKEWRQKNRVQDAARIRIRLYGTDGSALFETQKGLCAICQKTMILNKRGRGSAHLDHDHTTKKVRGWLCHACNVGLGMFGEDREVIRRALSYLG